jgi:DNA-directed RNA polymerase specialized sigma24 family protein
MNASSLLTEIYQSKEIGDVISRIQPEQIRDDLKQHVFLELFEQSEDFIIDLFTRGKLKAYIAKMLYNTARFSRTKFSKEMGKEIAFGNFEELEGKICKTSAYEIVRGTNDLRTKDDEFEELNCAVSQIYWYKARLLELYSEVGTYKKVSEVTGIPVASVFATITQARKEVKQLL